MDEKEFLSVVVPWEPGGYVTIHWQIPGKKGFPGKSFLTLNEAVEFIAELRQQGNCNIYFCLSQQRFNGGKRSRAGATGMNSVWADADVNPDDPRCYSRMAEAIADFLRFCLQMGIPKPSIMVKSGGGLHVYWLSNRTLSIEDWEPFASTLKNAFKFANMQIKDMGVTTDAARVLRVPNTSNLKYSPVRPVQVLDKYSTYEKHDFSVIFAGLKRLAPADKPQRIKVGPVPEAFKNIPFTQLGGAIERPPPPSWPAVKAQCGWLREAYETGGKDYDQPQWNLTTLCATFLEDGNELAHKFADQHPEYTVESTQELWDRKVRECGTKNLGWPSCRAISDSGSKHCKLCPHFTFGKTPLHLGLGVIDDAKDNTNSPEDPKDSQQASEQNRKNEELEEIGCSRPEEIRLPESFCFNALNHLCHYTPSSFANKQKIPAQLVVLIRNMLIRPPTLIEQDGKPPGIGFTIRTDKGNEREVVFHSGHISDLSRYLLSKFVLVNQDDKAIKMTRQFAISWLDKLSQEDVAIKDTGMGWRHDADGKKVGFAYGNMLYRENGEVQPLVAAGEDEFRKWYMPVGKKTAWLAACKLLTDRKRPELDILISVGFAAPLMTFAGAMYGSVLSAWGDPGTSKSTAQQVAAAIWGHPKQTRESLNSTPKSVQRRLGLTKNLASYWDDIQDERHQENLFQTMFVTAEGTEGGRLNTDATMKARLDWQTIMAACSNASFVEFLIKKQKSTTAGMRRVFEFEFNKRKDEEEIGLIDELDASKVFGKLEHNYGVVGAEYAKLLATRHKDIDKLVDVITKKFKAAVKGSAAESYWWSLCGVLLVGAGLANALGAEIDVRAMDTFLQAAYRHNRHIRTTEGTDGGSLINTENALSKFLNFHVSGGQALYVQRMFQNRHHKVHHIHGPISGKQVFVQFARLENRMYISKREFRHYMQDQEVQPRQVFDGLAKYYHAKEVRLTLGAGTVWAQTQETCFEFKVPNDSRHLLREMMDAKGKLEKPTPEA